MFVSSAGAYKANKVEPLHVEGDKRKASAGHVEVETYLREQNVPFTVFHPLYIYGPSTAKDCEQWFIDRVIRYTFLSYRFPGNHLIHSSKVSNQFALVASQNYYSYPITLFYA